MKKQFIFLMLAIIAATSISVSSPLKKFIEKSYSFKPPRIHIDIILAKPKTDCTRFPGVCMGETTISMEGRMHSGIKAGAFATYENGKLTLELPKNEMSDELISDLEKTVTLPIEDEGVFPPAILKALVAPADAMVAVGKYPVRKTESGYIIILDMK